MSSLGQRVSLAYSTPLVPAVILCVIDTQAYSGNLMKPTLDTLLFTSQLSRSLGFRGTLLLFGNYYLTIKVCTSSVLVHMDC